MMKEIKKQSVAIILICILLPICICILSGCVFNRENPYPYSGKYKELYTAAIYSIPDTVGYMYHGEGAGDDYLKNRTEEFYMKNRDKLKEKNDWNKPLNKSLCVSYHITDHKALGKDIYSLSSDECDEILNEYTETLNLSNPGKYPHRNNEVLQVDAEVNVLHEIIGVHQYDDNPNWKKQISILITT